MGLINVEKYTANRRRFVLIVENNERNKLLLSTLLKHFNYEPYAVSTARQAVEIASSVNPILIVAARQIDAGCNAVQLIKSLKSAKPACISPVIVLFSESEPAFERECLNAGALTCLHAPVTFENFYRVIQVAIEPVPRMTIRIDTNLPAAVNRKRTDECITEISEGGAYLLTNSLHLRDTELSVQIKLPDAVIDVDAVVIYAKTASEDTKNRTGMGLQFKRISEKDQKRIRLFIRREMAKGITPTSAVPSVSSPSR